MFVCVALLVCLFVCLFVCLPARFFGLGVVVNVVVDFVDVFV